MFCTDPDGNRIELIEHPASAEREAHTAFLGLRRIGWPAGQGGTALAVIPFIVATMASNADPAAIRSKLQARLAVVQAPRTPSSRGNWPRLTTTQIAPPLHSSGTPVTG